MLVYYMWLFVVAELIIVYITVVVIFKNLFTAIKLGRQLII